MSDLRVNERLRARVARAITDFHGGDWEPIVAYSDAYDGLKIQLEAADELIKCLNRHGVQLVVVGKQDEQGDSN